MCIDFFSRATTSSVRDVSGGGKEGEGEVGPAKAAEASHSHSVGITNEIGGSIDLDEVKLDYLLFNWAPCAYIYSLFYSFYYFIFQLVFSFKSLCLLLRL